MTQVRLFSGSAASPQQGRSRHVHYLFREAQPAPQGLAALLVAVEAWRERRRSRRELMRLSDYQLKDIGLSRLDAEQEFTKPFWRP